MLRVGPWNRLALTIQWLVPKYRVEFEPSLLPPPHMPIEEGRVISKKISSPQKKQAPTSSSTNHQLLVCDLCCHTMDDEEILNCLDTSCTLKVHIICLASHFLKSDPDRMLPLEGSCPNCSSDLLWADLIRKSQGCYQNRSLSLDETVLT